MSDAPALGAYRTEEQKEWTRRWFDGELWCPWHDPKYDPVVVPFR